MGARAFGLITALALVVAGNVLLQLFMHKTTPLTAWKGGGFGMYTEPHAEARGVWLFLKGTNGTAQVQLWPESADLKRWREGVSPKAASFLGGLVRDAERMRYYPTQANAQRLAKQASRVRWPETVIGPVTPANGKSFKGAEVVIEVTETDLDVATATANQTTPKTSSAARKTEALKRRAANSDSQ